MMNMTCGMSQRLELTQVQKLDQKFSLRLGLIQTLRGTEYKPKAECPKCFYQLTPGEIIKGFRRDPNDINTTCPKCGRRFAARLFVWDVAANTEMIFLCPCQTTERLRHLYQLKPDEIRRENATTYHSAIVHFGTLTNAFKEVGIDYSHTEKVDWKNKIQPFLGQMPDTEIAKCAGISVSTVRLMRRKLDIRRFCAN